jgi:hypothetical protein
MLYTFNFKLLTFGKSYPHKIFTTLLKTLILEDNIRVFY